MIITVQDWGQNGPKSWKYCAILVFHSGDILLIELLNIYAFLTTVPFGLLLLLLLEMGKFCPRQTKVRASIVKNKQKNTQLNGIKINRLGIE